MQFNETGDPNLDFPADSDVERLAQIFRDCTQPYKLLLFKAVIERLIKGAGEIMLFDELLAEILIAAWWPVVVSRLTIGNAAANDTLTALVHSLGNAVQEKLSPHEAIELARMYAERERSRGCLRYVPEALLSPWKASDGLPVYQIFKEGIAIPPQWYRYFKANLPIVKGWADNAWLSWMQARNPNVPVTIEKIGPPSRRLGLTKERAYFLMAMNRIGLDCIYTNQPLDRTGFSLDHFLPRSFVGHDRVWNLVPTSKSLNSAKAGRLPSLVFLDSLVTLHHRVVTEAVALSGGRTGIWLDQYCNDLRIAPARLLDQPALREAYWGAIPPLLTTAKRMGFPADWSLYLD